MSENYKPVNNENATDRDPYDQLSPEVDASVNVFEENPDDSVDITAEYDEDKAQAIEEDL